MSGNNSWSKPGTVVSLENRAMVLIDEINQIFDGTNSETSFIDQISQIGDKMIVFAKSLNEGLTKEAGHFLVSPKEIVRLRSKAYSACSDVMACIKTVINFDEKSFQAQKSLADFERCLRKFIAPYPQFDLFFEARKNVSRLEDGKDFLNGDSVFNQAVNENLENLPKFQFDSSQELLELLENALSFYQENENSLQCKNEINFFETVIQKTKNFMSLNDEEKQKNEIKIKEKEMEIEEIQRRNSSLEKDFLNKDKMIRNLEKHMEIQDSEFSNQKKNLLEIQNSISSYFQKETNSNFQKKIKPILQNSDNILTFLQDSFTFIIDQNKELKEQINLLSSLNKQYEENEAILRKERESAQLEQINKLQLQINQYDSQIKQYDNNISNIFSLLSQINQINNESKSEIDNEKENSNDLQNEKGIKQIKLLEEKVKILIETMKKDEVELSKKKNLYESILNKLGTFSQFVHEPIEQDELILLSLDRLLKLYSSQEEIISKFKSFKISINQILNKENNDANNNKDSEKEIDNTILLQKIQLLKYSIDETSIKEQNYEESTKKVKHLESENHQMTSQMHKIEEKLQKLTNESVCKKEKDLYSNIINLLTVLEDSITFTQNELKQLRLVSTEEITHMKEIIQKIDPRTQTSAWTFVQYLDYFKDYLQTLLEKQEKEQKENEKKKKNIKGQLSNTTLLQLFEPIFDIIPVTSKENPEKYIPEIISGAKSLHDSVMALKPFAQNLNEISSLFDCKLSSFNPKTPTFSKLKEQFQALHNSLSNLQPTKVNSLVFLVLSRFVALISSIVTIIYSLPSSVYQ